MTPAEGSNFLTKFVEAIKDLPAWLFTALAVAAGLCMLDGIESKELHSFPSVHGQDHTQTILRLTLQVLKPHFQRIVQTSPRMA